MDRARHAARRRRTGLDPRPKLGDALRARERPRPLDRLPQRDGERELIGARVAGRTAHVAVAGDRPIDLLGRHVRRGPDQRARLGQRAGQHRAVETSGRLGRILVREPEVDDLHPTVVTEQHVLGLEVSVHDAGGVRGRQASSCGQEDGERLRGLVRFRHPRAQARTAHELHREVERVVLHADVEDGDDVRMCEACERLRLAQQACALGRVVRGAEALDRDLAIELRIVGDVHRAHRTFAQSLSQLEATEPRGRGACAPRGDDAGCQRRHHVLTALASIEVQISCGQRVAVEATLEEREQDLVVGTRHVGLVLS